jgi:hypothetical protein
MLYVRGDRLLTGLFTRPAKATITIGRVVQKLSYSLKLGANIFLSYEGNNELFVCASRKVAVE